MFTFMLSYNQNIDPVTQNTLHKWQICQKKMVPKCWKFFKDEYENTLWIIAATLNKARYILISYYKPQILWL